MDYNIQTYYRKIILYNTGKNKSTQWATDTVQIPIPLPQAINPNSITVMDDTFRLIAYLDDT